MAEDIYVHTSKITTPMMLPMITIMYRLSFSGESSGLRPLVIHVLIIASSFVDETVQVCVARKCVYIDLVELKAVY